jgi:hypothetical protein
VPEIRSKFDKIALVNFLYFSSDFQLKVDENLLKQKIHKTLLHLIMNKCYHVNNGAQTNKIVRSFKQYLGRL